MRARLFSLILTAAILLMLPGCGEQTAPEKTQPQQGTTGTTQVPTTRATQPAVPEFTETVLVEDENCKFAIVSIDTEGDWGYTLKAYLENKTDKELMFSVESVSVNGFMCDPFWAATVSAGMKANEQISFMAEDLAVNGITEVTDVTFTLAVFDSDDWTADRLVDEEFTIYPMGEAAVKTYTREPQATDIVLFDNAQCTMIVTGFEPDSLWGYGVKVYLENKTEDDLMFSVNGASVNGYMCDPFWAESVAPGKRSNSVIEWMEGTLTDNGITQVETITLPVAVYDSDDWAEDMVISETFTITP